MGMFKLHTHRRRDLRGRGPALDLSEILSDLPRWKLQRGDRYITLAIGEAPNDYNVY